ncbi:MAG TPA: DMT family transporter, partial [Actinomycetota bacterium]|nr:DMT family transporter [Actinomycetota bacterium]
MSAGARTTRRVDPGFFLYVTPVLWGATFPAAKLGLEAIGILPFMAWTRLLGFVAILAAIPFVPRREITAPAVRRVLLPGLLLGTLIFVAYILQTVGLSMTKSTNAGFITGLYVVFTPLLGLVLFRRGARASAWVAVVVSLAGMT